MSFEFFSRQLALCLKKKKKKTPTGILLFHLITFPYNVIDPTLNIFLLLEKLEFCFFS